MQSRSALSSAVFLQKFAAVRLHLGEAIPERFELSGRFPRCEALDRPHFRDWHAVLLDHDDAYFRGFVNDGTGASIEVRNADLSHTYIVTTLLLSMATSPET